MKDLFPVIRRGIEELGGTFIFDTRATDFEFENIETDNSKDTVNSYISSQIPKNLLYYISFHVNICNRK